MRITNFLTNEYKTNFIVLIMPLTSFAPWKEIDEKLDLRGTEKPRPEQTSVSTEAEIPQEPVRPAKIIDKIRTTSEDNKSVFIVMKTSKDDLFASIYFENTKVNYKRLKLLRKIIRKSHRFETKLVNKL